MTHYGWSFENLNLKSSERLRTISKLNVAFILMEPKDVNLVTLMPYIPCIPNKPYIQATIFELKYLLFTEP